MEGFTFHGLRASSVEKLREAGCEDRHIEAITGMSTRDDFTLQPLCRSEAPCQGRDGAARRANAQRTQEVNAPGTNCKIPPIL
jgi:hypothetical protein